MTPAEIAAAAEYYHHRLVDADSFKATPVRMPNLSERYNHDNKHHLPNHLAWMCEHILKLLIQKETEKACRWLGFVQGCFYMMGELSIDNLRTHNGTKDIP
jgi:hypothetical protein